MNPSSRDLGVPVLLLLGVLLAGCAAAPPHPAPVVNAPATRPQATAEKSPAPPAQAQSQPSVPAGERPDWGKRYYLDDGPGDAPPVDLDSIPDAIPLEEPLHKFANRPYSVFGVDYEPVTAPDGYSRRGIASWYGRRFHGQRTSSGEPYDMYKMSAAHPTLPIPSYARVTNLANGRSVVVRINDRGPFHPARLIDLSYAAAYRLGYASKGSTEVLVQAIRPGEEPSRVEIAAANRAVASEIAGAPAVPVSTGKGRRQMDGGTTGQWLQLGAFANRGNAERLQRDVESRLPELGTGLRIVERETRWLLQAGPLLDTPALETLQKLLRDRLGLRAIRSTR